MGPQLARQLTCSDLKCEWCAQPFVVLGGHSHTVTAVAFSADGALCTASQDRVVVWDVDVFVRDPSRGKSDGGPARRASGARLGRVRGCVYVSAYLTGGE